MDGKKRSHTSLSLKIFKPVCTCTFPFSFSLSCKGKKFHLTMNLSFELFGSAGCVFLPFCLFVET